MFVSGTVMVIISKTVPDTPRINVTPASAAHAELLKYWSVLTGRSASSLCSSLLEETLNRKLEEGSVHPTAVRLMEEVIKNREALLKFDHKQNLIFEQMRADQEYEKIFKDFEKLKNGPEGFQETLSTKPIGEFTDKEWSQSKKTIDLEGIFSTADKIFELFKEDFSSRESYYDDPDMYGAGLEECKKIKREIFASLKNAKSKGFDVYEIFDAINKSRSYLNDNDVADFINDLTKDKDLTKDGVIDGGIY